jgi:hypothetical protein
MKFGYLIATGILCADAAQHLSSVPKNVVVFALAWVLHAVFELRSRVPLAVLLVSLWSDMLAPLSQRGPG